MTDNIKGEIHNRNFDIFQERKYNTLTDEEKRELKWQRRKNKEKLTLQKKK